MRPCVTGFMRHLKSVKKKKKKKTGTQHLCDLYNRKKKQDKGKKGKMKPGCKSCVFQRPCEYWT